MIKKAALFISIAGILLLGGALIYGSSQGALSSEMELEIDAKQKEVWSYFQNPGNFKKWMSGFEKIEMLEGIPGTVGSTYALHFNNDGNEQVLHQELTSIDPPNGLSFNLTNDLFAAQLDIRMSENAGKTKMIVNMTSEGNNAFYNAAMHLAKDDIDLNQRKNYEAFKNLLENK